MFKELVQQPHDDFRSRRHVRGRTQQAVRKGDFNAGRTIRLTRIIHARVGNVTSCPDLAMNGESYRFRESTKAKEGKKSE